MVSAADMKCTPKRVTSRIEVSSKHGDESNKFISMIDICVHIGYRGRDTMLELFASITPMDRSSLRRIFAYSRTKSMTDSNVFLDSVLYTFE